MKETEALDFYERVTEGTQQYEEITLEHNSGAALSGFRMHVVDKQTLARVIEQLPDAMFEGVEDIDNPEEAEERLEEEGGSMDAVTENTVTSFEDLVSESLAHSDLTSVQIEHIIEELDFEVLFELGTDIIDMSVEQTGKVRDFHKQG